MHETRSDRTSTNGNSSLHGRMMIVMLISVLLLLFLIPYFGFQKDTEFYPILGGAIGALSSLAAIVGIRFTSGDLGPPLTLLFWRSACDLGLAVRFLASNGFDLMVCQNETCHAGANDSNQKNCYVASAMFQFFEMASEGWLLCIGLDLYFSMTQPFSSFKSRQKYYHLFVWTFAISYAMPTWFSDAIYGFWNISDDLDDAVVCWIKLGNSNGAIGSISYKPWVMFYIPLVIIYGTCLAILVYAYLRLKRGIPRTILHRMKALVTNAINITIYLSYWFVLGLAYGFTYVALDNHDTGTAIFLFDGLLYLISAKGFSSVLVLVTLMNTDIGDPVENDQKHSERLDLNSALRQEVLHFATLGIRCAARVTKKHIDEKAANSRSANESTDLSQHSSDMSDQETTLRFDFGTEENTLADVLSIVFFIKLVFGMRYEVQKLNSIMRQTSKTFAPQSVGVLSTVANVSPMHQGNPSRFSQRKSRLSSKTRASETSPEIDDDNKPISQDMGPSGIALSPIGSSTDGSDHNESRNHSVNLLSEIDEEEEFISRAIDEPKTTLTWSQLFRNTFSGTTAPSRVEFTEFEPLHFRRVRAAAGIEDSTYVTAFKTTIKERLTEGGASGAFFFFSQGEVFIAKSCTTEEIETLRSAAKQYADYLEQNTGSYISRIYGAYRLKIYSSSLHFFVMNNIFLNADNAVIHEKYDIKGSWVARNATPPRDGQMVTCTHCAQKYVYRRKIKPLKIPKPRGMTVVSNDTSQRNPSFVGRLIDFVGWTNSDIDIAVSDEQSPMERHCPHTVKGYHEPNVVLKDNDLKYKIRLPLTDAHALLKQLKDDSEFLKSIGVMDFSLLVGVHNTHYDVNPEGGSFSMPSESEVSIGNDTNGKSSSFDSRHTSAISPLTRKNSITITARHESNAKLPKAKSSSYNPVSKKLQVSRVVGPESYYMGIIDYQQKWNWNKKLERFFKIRFKRADSNGLSAIEPELYKERFIRHIEDILDLAEPEEQVSRQATEDFAISGEKL